MLGVADYGAFVAAILIFLAIPGPGNLALITSTGKGGIRGGLGATFGVIAGDQVLMWAAVAGVAALLGTYPAAFHVVQWAGAAYLAWLGGKMLLAKPGAYAFIGNGDGSHRAMHHGGGPCLLHNASYDFNDDLIPLGATCWVELAEQFLNGPALAPGGAA